MSESSPDGEGRPHRVLALVLPELLCEVAARSTPTRESAAFGVVLVSPGEPGFDEAEPLRATARLDAVSRTARRFGVRAGQSIAEAGALHAGLDVRRLDPATVERALAAVAELALAFGATVALSLPDTVWVDVTGSAHLFGGEEALGEELGSRVRALGHVVRVAVAGGPELSRAFARWAPAGAGQRGVFAVSSEAAPQAVGSLPVVALPISEECRDWLVRLGVLTWGDLAVLPRATLGSRLSGEAGRAIELSLGIDPTPLVPYEAPPSIQEEVSFECGLDGYEPLLFALRGLSARLSARLGGRGLAAETLELEIVHDRSIAKLRGAQALTSLKFALSTPLFREEELCRIVSSKLERTRLPAPSVALRLSAPVLVSAQARQLELGQVLLGGTDAARELPLLIAELSADVGEAQVGVLKMLDAHRLEVRSELGPALPAVARRGRRTTEPRRGGRRSRSAPPVAVHVSGSPLAVIEGNAAFHEGEEQRAPLTRLLPSPVELDTPLRVGATLAVERRLYSIEALRFEHRLHAVEWWTGTPVERDYVRVWLRGSEGIIETLSFVDRSNGRRYLQAIAD
ncbi:MAG TPA: DNA polymerase Y family protein [Polyangiaceae bacterium]